MLLIMKPEALEIYKKYNSFVWLLSDDSYNLFRNDKNELDHEAFFEMVQYINYMHYLIKGHWKNYKKRRSELIKKFEYNKMEILLRPHFCTDIKNLILTFLY